MSEPRWKAALKTKKQQGTIDFKHRIEESFNHFIALLAECEIGEENYIDISIGNAEVYFKQCGNFDKPAKVLIARNTWGLCDAEMLTILKGKLSEWGISYKTISCENMIIIETKNVDIYDDVRNNTKD